MTTMRDKAIQAYKAASLRQLERERNKAKKVLYERLNLWGVWPENPVVFFEYCNAQTMCNARIEIEGVTFEATPDRSTAGLRMTVGTLARQVHSLEQIGAALIGLDARGAMGI